MRLKIVNPRQLCQLTKIPNPDAPANAYLVRRLQQTIRVRGKSAFVALTLNAAVPDTPRLP